VKARLIAIIPVTVLFVFADTAPAGLITFNGVIDEVRGNTAPFGVGDTFTAAFFFFGPPSASLQRPIHSFRMSVGDFSLRGSRPRSGSVAIELDVSQTNLLYQIFQARTHNGPAPYNGSITDIALSDPAIGGVIPPFDQLLENFFVVSLDFGGRNPPESDVAIGHLTSFPEIRATSGHPFPENGSAFELLGLALFVLACLRTAIRGLKPVTNVKGGGGAAPPPRGPVGPGG